MDKFFKDLSIGESRNLVLKCLGESNNETVEKFWFVELDKCTLTKKDSDLYNRIFKLKNSKDDVSKSIYKNCLNGICTGLFPIKNFHICKSFKILC